MIHKVGDIISVDDFYWGKASLLIISVVKKLDLYVVRKLGATHPILYWISISEIKENEND